MLQFVPICAQTHTFQNPASIWKCKKLSQNRETLGIIQLHGQDRYSRAVSTQDKKPQLGVLASPCSCCQAPWHGLCTRLWQYPRAGSSGVRILVPQAASCSNSPKAPNRQEQSSAQGHYKSYQSFLLLCPMYIPTACGSISFGHQAEDWTRVSPGKARFSQPDEWKL